MSKFVKISKGDAKTMFEDGITVYFNTKELDTLDYEPEVVKSEEDFTRKNMEWFVENM